MATFCVASTPIPAHTLNATKIVRGLTGAGHRVLWYLTAPFAAHARACGAEPVIAGPDALAVEVAWSSPGGLGGLAHVRRLYREIADRTPVQVAELSDLVTGHDVDALVTDTLLPSVGLVAELHGRPWASFGDGPLLSWDEDTPPFGTGLQPLPGPAGRHRNRHVQATIDRWLFADAVRLLNQTRAGHGLAPVADIRQACLSPRLHLQGCPPGLEYPRRPLPRQVHFVGALGPGAGFGPPLPTALTRPPRTRPLAFVTQGTLRPDPSELAQPAARALVAEGFDVLVAGMTDGPWNRWPGRVTAVARVDYQAALAQADLFVTNGGYTGVTLAVAAGVPVVQCGSSEEKPDIGARVAWAGVGVAVRLTRPPWWLIRWAVRRVLRSPRRRRASAALAAECAHYDAEARSASLLTDLARTADRG